MGNEFGRGRGEERKERERESRACLFRLVKCNNSHNSKANIYIEVVWKYSERCAVVGFGLKSGGNEIGIFLKGCRNLVYVTFLPWHPQGLGGLIGDKLSAFSDEFIYLFFFFFCVLPDFFFSPIPLGILFIH